ncbi:MAG: hypothetical protein COS95_04345 [Ignavibacteriales bacterium CG07_land_8_20_14_0_80_59_12]|nr:MAG: hypothetical protein COS95_04345 [Ignavibacteriales bacterium CG07_land_8_20_14_0_80_59_12]
MPTTFKPDRPQIPIQILERGRSTHFYIQPELGQSDSLHAKMIQCFTTALFVFRLRDGSFPLRTCHQMFGNSIFSYLVPATGTFTF